MHVPLRDGLWAELREHISHADDKAINRATRAARTDPERTGESDTVALRAFISSWKMVDRDGQPLELAEPDAIDRMPSDLADQLIGLVVPILFPQATVPNEPTPPSSADSSSASESAEQRSTDSQTPSSSATPGL